MVRNFSTFLRLNKTVMPGVVLTLAALVTTPMFSRDDQEATPRSLAGIPWDWSHHHLIFSKPATTEQAAELQQDPRYWHQWHHRALQAAGAAPEPSKYPPLSLAESEASKQKSQTGLWGQSLVSASATVGALNYPAKFSFSTSAPTSANCAGGSAPDYVVFNTGVAGSSTQASIVAFDNLYASSTCSGTVPQTYWAYNTGGTVSTSVVLSESGSQVAFIQSVGGAASLVVLTWSATGGTISGTTASGSENVTVSSCNPVIAGEPISGPGVPSGTTISSCTGTTLVLSQNASAGATVLLTYNNQFTASTTASTSVTVPSGACSAIPDGSPIFGGGIPQGDTVASCSGTTLGLTTAATAHASATITFSPATAAAPVALTSNSSYPTCTAPCMISVPFNNGKNDTISSPFYNYDTDTLYVGDGSGNLHQFNPVFKGTTTEIVSSGKWPIDVSSAPLTSPVFDSGSGYVFVADSGGSGGYLYSYDPTTTPTLELKTSRLINTDGEGIVDAPVVDSSAKTVYVFVGDDANTTTSSSGSGCFISTGCSGVFRFSTTTTGTGSGTCTTTNGTSWPSGTICGEESFFGEGATSTILYAGTFDNTYYTGTGTTGNLWTCASGDVGNDTYVSPRLTASEMSSFSSALSDATVSSYNQMTSVAQSTCSPVTEIYNVSTDYIYLSIPASGNLSKCTGACLYSFTLSGTTPTISAGRNVAGGTSGIIVDNTGSGGGSQIYFTYLTQATASITCPSPSNATSGGCAVQTSQSALN